jgi:hypothetical protein
MLHRLRPLQPELTPGSHLFAIASHDPEDHRSKRLTMSLLVSPISPVNTTAPPFRRSTTARVAFYVLLLTPDSIACSSKCLTIAVSSPSVLPTPSAVTHLSHRLTSALVVSSKRLMPLTLDSTVRLSSRPIPLLSMFPVRSTPAMPHTTAHSSRRPVTRRRRSTTLHTSGKSTRHSGHLAVTARVSSAPRMPDTTAPLFKWPAIRHRTSLATRTPQTTAPPFMRPVTRHRTSLAIRTSQTTAPPFGRPAIRHRTSLATRRPQTTAPPFGQPSTAPRALSISRPPRRPMSMHRTSLAIRTLETPYRPP